MKDKDSKTRLLEEYLDISSRLSGRTTRLTDHYVQELYNRQGEWLEIRDHFGSVMAHKMLIERVIRRMKIEHTNDTIEIDKIGMRLKLISSQADEIRKREKELYLKIMDLKKK